MRIIHTADWHLGKTLKNQSLIDDQKYILDEFLKLLDASKIDAVIIAGDIYDRAIPPVDAINLLDEIISKLIERKIPVLSISGNHDSAERLHFGRKLFAQSNFFINTKPVKNPAPIVLSDKFGEVYFSLIPFFEAAEIKNVFAQNELDINAANKFYIAECRKKIPAGKRSVAVAHLFAAGGLTSESERKFVGAVENVDAANFADYNYTALGHLHKPQTMKKNNYIVRYSGSLLKYSFDEARYNKGVTLINLDGAGKTSFEHIDLKPRRDVRIIEGTVDELKNSARSLDYIHANLTDKNHVLYAMEKLRDSAFPNILSVQFINLERKIENPARAMEMRENVSIIENFADFFEFETGEKLTGEYRQAMEKFLSKLESEQL